MAGNVGFEIFKLIKENPIPEVPTLDLPANTLFSCCSDFSLKVLATTDTNDEYKNDRSSFIYWFDPVVSAAVLVLQRYQNGDYEQVALLNDATYGTAYLYGFFTNVDGDKFVGYQLDWKEVLIAFGEGSYRVVCKITLSYGGTGEKASNEFCLKTYSPILADVTVRLEYYLNGITADIDFDYKRKNFGELNWFNQLRLPGFFGYPSSEYETTTIMYNDGQQPFVEDNMVEEYNLMLKPLPYFVHNILKTDFMMADSAFVTDYNSRNNSTFVKKQVIKKSGYAPKWSMLRAMLAPIELKFNPYFNNNKKFRN